MAATSAAARTADAAGAAGTAGAPGGSASGAADTALSVARKLAGAVVSLFAVSVTGFFLFRIIPGDPIRTMTRGHATSAAQIAELTKEFGLDKPLSQQFVDYLDGLLHGNLGLSYQYRTPVADLIASHVRPTVLLVGTALVIAVLLGLWLGTRAGWHPGGIGDRINTGIALTLWSVPTFWLGLLLIIGLAVGVGGLPGLFPTGGMDSGDGSTGWAHIADVADHMVLPVITLVAVTYAQFLMIMRSSLLDERDADYLTTARAKGLREDLVRRRHAVPNAMLPTVTLIFVNLGEVVAGQILVETVFSWPGLGSLFYDALRIPDLPVLQGLFLFFAAAVILANLAADLLYPLLDPRVRAS
jgi:peptide/nickel transport system permease protein